MNEQQLKSLIRQGFALQDVAVRSVEEVDALLGRVMYSVKQLVQQLPEESLLRGKAWRDLQPLVKLEMEPYAQGLRQAITEEEIAAAPGMKDYAAREARYAGAAITEGLGAPAAASVVDQLNRAKVGKARFRELFMPKQGPVTPWTLSMFRVVDQKVRAGMIEGLTTQAIADQVVHETISRGVPGVSLQGETTVRKIRAQAMAMARTVTQDVAHQIKEELWNANPEATKDMIYQWTAALDSKTCWTCAPLDNTTYKRREDAPQVPLHVNYRCRLLLIDPDDKFWKFDRLTGQQISETEFRYKDKRISQLNKTEKQAARRAGNYVSKVKVKGERFYRKAVEFTGSDFSDYLANSNELTQMQFFGGGSGPSKRNPKGGIGYRRMQYFRKQIAKKNADPQQVLADMLTGPRNAKKFIPLP